MQIRWLAACFMAAVFASATTGMAAAKQPYSGQFGFIETYSMWPITHMVAPKAKALACDACHTENGRMSKVPGVSPE